MSVCWEFGVHAALPQCEAVTAQLASHASHCIDRDVGSGADGGHVPRGRSPCTQAPSAPKHFRAQPALFPGQDSVLSLESQRRLGVFRTSSGSSAGGTVVTLRGSNFDAVGTHLLCSFAIGGRASLVLNGDQWSGRADVVDATRDSDSPAEPFDRRIALVHVDIHRSVRPVLL